MCSLTCATYNILNPFHAVKWAEEEGLNQKGKGKSKQLLMQATGSKNTWERYSNWSSRKLDIYQNILNSQADIICLQEVSKKTLKYLEELLRPKYQLAFKAFHSCQSPQETYGNAMIYDPKKVEILSTAVLQHRQQVGRIRRAASVVCKIANQTLIIASVHLSYSNEKANSGFEELQTYVRKLEECARKKKQGEVDGIILCGDLNEGQSEDPTDEPRLSYLKNSGYIWDQHPAITRPKSQDRLDWIFYKTLSPKKKLTLTPTHLEENQVQASDHLMTATQFQWTSETNLY